MSDPDGEWVRPERKDPDPTLDKAFEDLEKIIRGEK